MSVIRVCFVAPKAYPLFNPAAEGVFGGAEVDMYHLATELAKDERFAVHCVVADYGQERAEQWEGVNVVKGVYFDNHPLRAAFRLWGILKGIDADIYFAKTFSPGVPLLAYYCRRHRCHFVYRTASQKESDRTFLQEKPLLGKWCIRALRGASHIFSQNRVDADNLKRLFGLETQVVPNGHRLPAMEDRPRDIILWSGRSAAEKGAGRFLDLAEQFPDLSFVFICQRATRDAGYDELTERVQRLPNVQHIPRVPFRQMNDYFLRARVLVNTSDTEGFPNAFIEAAECGCPILSYKVNPDQFLDRHQCGLCGEGNWEAFVEKFQELLKPDVAGTCSRNARVYAEANHNIGKIIETYKSAFEKLIQQ